MLAEVVFFSGLATASLSSKTRAFLNLLLQATREKETGFALLVRLLLHSLEVKLESPNII